MVPRGVRPGVRVRIDYRYGDLRADWFGRTVRLVHGEQRDWVLVVPDGHRVRTIAVRDCDVAGTADGR